MQKYWAHFLVALTLITLAACSRGQPAAGDPLADAAISPTGTSASQAVSQVKGVSGQLPTPSLPARQVSAAEPAESTALPSQPMICSPLGEHPLAELPEIVSAPYDPPPPGKEERHHGVDFSYYRRGERESILGVGVQSVFAGRAAAALADTFPYGNVVIIETPAGELPLELVDGLGITEDESVYTLYAHMGTPPLVRTGDDVGACQRLGEVGMSGNAGVPHLHLEMRIGPQGGRFEGMAFYSTRTTEEERDNYTLWRTSGVYRHFDPLDVLTSSGGE